MPKYVLACGWFLNAMAAPSRNSSGRSHGLQLSDVDLRDGWLSVRLETTKTDAGERVVLLDPQVAALLDGYINDVRGTKPGPLFLNAAR